MVETVSGSRLNTNVGPAIVGQTTPAANVQDLLKHLNAAVQDARPNLTERDVKEMFLKRLGPSLEAMTNQAESIGKTVIGQVQGDLLAQQEAQLEKTRVSLKNGVLDSLINNIVGFFTATADVFKGAAEQVQALYTQDKAGVLELVTQMFHTVKSTFEQIIRVDPFMRMALMNDLFKNPLPAKDLKTINAANN